MGQGKAVTCKVAFRARKRSQKKKQGMEAGVFNVPLLLAIEPIHNLRLVLGRSA
jgi:hypothetical protein